jgi:hypothetical protein
LPRGVNAGAYYLGFNSTSISSDGADDSNANGFSARCLKKFFIDVFFAFAIIKLTVNNLKISKFMTNQDLLQIEKLLEKNNKNLVTKKYLKKTLEENNKNLVTKKDLEENNKNLVTKKDLEENNKNLVTKDELDKKFEAFFEIVKFEISV